MPDMLAHSNISIKPLIMIFVYTVRNIGYVYIVRNIEFFYRVRKYDICL